MKRILSTFICLMIGLLCYGQAPQAFSYQAVAIGDDGSVLVNQNIGVKININMGSANGITDYSETHTVTTSSAGLFSVEVGYGTPVTNTFSDIDWSTGSYFLSVEVDENGTGIYQNIGIVQLLSVPYALYAETGNIGPQGFPGAQGAEGPAGAQGPPGPSGAAAPQSPQGPINTISAGPVGPMGPQGPKGLPGGGTSCWDLNSNLLNDFWEDKNGDGLFTALDCTGPKGSIGLAGDPGPAGVNSNSVGSPGGIGPAGYKGIEGPMGPIGPTIECSPWTKSEDNVSFFGSVGVGTSTPSCELDVIGSVSSYGITLSSDIRYKENILQLNGMLGKVKQLKGVQYLFRTAEYANHNFPESLQVGLIAQEVEEIFPELVITKVDGYKAVDYSKLSPILLEALKTLYHKTQSANTQLVEKYEHLENEVEALKASLIQNQ